MFIQATEPRFVDPVVAGLKDPLDIIDRCRKRIDELGYDVRQKDPGGRFSGFSSVRGGVLWLSSDFLEKSHVQRAKVFAHELTHVLQQVEIGKAKYALGYLRPRNLWIWEVQGYANGVRALVRMGVHESEIDHECERVGETLWREYLPVRWFEKGNLLRETKRTLRSVVTAELSRQLQ